MRKLFKYHFPVEVFGIAACILLMLSRYLGALETNGMQALNHVLVVVTLCVCVHFVRRTAQLSRIHVWNDPLLSFVWGLPVFNLVITALQLMIGETPVFSSPVFVAVSILLSLPTFFCLYFVYAIRGICRAKPLRICCCILFGVWVAYTVLRLADKAILPALAASGTVVNEALLRAAAVNPTLSVLIYALAILCFIIQGSLREKASAKKE